MLSDGAYVSDGAPNRGLAALRLVVRLPDTVSWFEARGVGPVRISAYNDGSLIATVAVATAGWTFANTAPPDARIIGDTLVT